MSRYYYKVAILRSAAPHLTYSSTKAFEIGEIVDVYVKTKIKRAVVLKEVQKPDFDTKDIEDSENLIYSDKQFKIAKFISEYYFSSFSEAISLFLPYQKDSNDSNESDTIEIAELPVLSMEQKRVYEQMNQYDRALLFGVTGSGKTEIFINKIAQTLKDGKNAILLMPEISLTPQMEKRLKKYFKDSIAIWHSKLTKKKKESIIEGIENGTVKIVAGARSALFTPLKNLGLIIVDEEHDDSYKSMTRPRYHARDLALYTGQIRKAQVWLASATPSCSSYMKYPVVKLSNPYIKTKKTYKFTSGSTITPSILKEIEDNYKRGEQSLVFVPTRANFKYLRCESCGETHKCPFCSVGMSLHRQKRYLRCHYCEYTEPITDICQNCGYSPLTSEREGTQEVIETIKNSIEGIKVEQFDKDAINTPRQLENALNRIAKGESDVIVGTQMLSKGHDYPNITLSVITGLDYLIGLADYRARERAVSLLHQIAGRSGRSKDATILIQSANADFFSFYIKDYEEFIRDELEFLEIAQYPPYSNLARVLIADKREDIARNLTNILKQELERFDAIEIIGAGKAPVERVAQKWRYTILMRSSNRKTLLQALHSIKNNNIEIDMDPVDFS